VWLLGYDGVDEEELQVSARNLAFPAELSEWTGRVTRELRGSSASTRRHRGGLGRRLDVSV